MKTLARERDRAEILQRVNALGPESSRRWGRMSPHQMVCHLTDSFRMMTGERPVSPATGVIRQTIIKCIAFYDPLRWPSGIMTRPELDQEIGGTRPAAFAAHVTQLQALLELVATTQMNTVDRLAHPIFGGMSKAAWLRWAYLHADHHLRQFGV